MGSPIRGILIGVPVSLALWGCGFYAARAGLDVPPAPPPDMAAIAAQAAAQVQQMVPAPSMQTPPPAALDSVQGTGTTYARADHTHAVRVQRTVLTTAADGTATWTFARPIAVAAGKVPPVAYMVEDLGSPVVVQVTGRAMTSDGTTDTHTAVTIKAQRSRTLPATLLTLATLVSFDIFGIPATGTKVNLFAADPTQ